jgi:flagellar motor switch protein FliG
MAGELEKKMDDLSGPEKAAVIMLALGNEHGAALWPLMDDEEIRDISMAMASLGKIDPEVIELLVVDFATQMTSTGTIVGSMDSTERLLRDILPQDRVDTILEEIRGPAGRTMWDKLSNVNEMVLANYLRNEYPQTVAVVLSKIRSEHAARVLSSLPEDFALEVVMRMLRMESVQKDILDKVERTLRVEFMNNLARTNRRDSHELMADIFNNLDRNAEGRFMASLEERNRDAAEKIKALMFTFEDLLRLDPGGVQTLIRGVENNRLALALKGSSDSIRDLFFSNMSERAAKILREDMDAMGPVRLRDVDESQSEIVATAKDLADRGEIMLADNKDDDELIY